MRLIYAAILLVQEGEEHAEEGRRGLDLILPPAAELIWGIVCFVIVLVVLTKYAFPALRKSVEAREQKIADDLEAAEKAKLDAQREQDEYKRQLGDARSEANRIIEEARQSAEQVRKDLIAKAESDAKQIVERAQEQLEAERNRTVQELQSQVAEMSIELAEKVVNRALDDKTHRDLVDAYIKEVGSMPAGSQN